jgi:hypothetical protein
MNICAIAVPYDSGHYRGRMGLGPERLLAGGIRSLLENFGHSLTVEEVTLADGYLAEIKTAFALCREVSNRVREVRRKASFPLVLSGNCNTAVGAVAGAEVKIRPSYGLTLTGKRPRLRQRTPVFWMGWESVSSQNSAGADSLLRFRNSSRFSANASCWSGRETWRPLRNPCWVS